MTKRAFTLIELLVVIAIIAILAAILFPVFAQAKEAAKKTTTLSQYKQVGTGAQIYLSDSDDTFPLGESFDNNTGVWRSFNYHAVPNGWTSSGGRDVEPRKSEEGVFVLNSMFPYTKNYSIYSANGLANSSVGAVQSPNGPKPENINVAYNGLLHAWSATAVAQPSKLPLFWAGNYKENVVGMTTSNPLLDCTAGGQDCRFNPGGSAQSTGGTTYGWFGSGATQANGTVFVYGKGMPFVSADTSARFIQFNAPKYPQYAENVNSSPFSSFDSTAGYPEGAPYWMTDCNVGAPFNANAIWPGYFRPDSEFNYTPEQCQFIG
ncbi:prepilin-type N-terminal cleavage/methylation domain-containing protein [bacterium]|nr:MAG: prepilin-type N-terminal cleavage/methylation domain-containing protein [bacterium]